LERRLEEIVLKPPAASLWFSLEISSFPGQ
jgi:hypothetical protein